MTATSDRQQIIGEAYEAFRQVRKLPADQLCVAVVNLALQANGANAMSPDEVRLVDAHIQCTWDKWQDASQPAPITPDDAWGGWPETAGAGIRGRATLWD
jgi:hypothetical protein